MAITQGKTPLESVPQAADPERGLKSRMLGNPLVRFCEGQGGNQMMVRVTPNLRAPCLLDPGFNRVFRSYVIAHNRFNGLPLSAIATQLRNR